MPLRLLDNDVLSVGRYTLDVVGRICLARKVSPATVVCCLFTVALGCVVVQL